MLVAEAGHAFRAARLPGVAEIIDEPRPSVFANVRTNRKREKEREEGRSRGKRADASRERGD